MVAPSVPDRIIELMHEYRLVGVLSVTADDLARALRIKHSLIVDALQVHIRNGVVHYAKKHPRSSMSRYELGGGCNK